MLAVQSNRASEMRCLLDIGESTFCVAEYDVQAMPALVRKAGAPTA